ncbi:MAG TPA: efflux RND transporter periplasmic adaptor subunit [Pelomicrobium sp.]|nr:efflux RND transporter periplasmic adaptor subunit [Pelomicrobium sp.]
MLTLLIAAAAGAGYWVGAARTPDAPQAAASAAPERKILHYRNPMGLPDTSPVPKKDSMGMDYIPVYVDEATASKERRILYYRNPMGLPDTSPVPKKDSMGMDYIPVYEEDEPAGSTVRISVEKVQKLGVRTEAVALRELARPLRAVGTLQVDERRVHKVAPRFEGWIEKLHVNATAQSVARGQPLMDVYSPELVAAQREYVVAWRALQSLPAEAGDARDGMRRLADAAIERLRNWEISDADLARLRTDGASVRTLTLLAPAGGVVMEKPAIQGMRFMPGEAMFSIADLSSLWLLVDVFEQELALVKPGQHATITVNAYPGQTFAGKVAFVYPVVNPQTRTAQVRVELPNPGGRLKPAMYASVELAAAAAGKVVAAPISAVLNSGTRQIVLVELAAGRYQPRPVRLGLQSDDYVEVLEGLGEGERVVVAANFLIDAESNLRAALGAFTPPATDLPFAGPPDGAAPAAAYDPAKGH